MLEFIGTLLLLFILFSAWLLFNCALKIELQPSKPLTKQQILELYKKQQNQQKNHPNID